MFAMEPLAHPLRREGAEFRSRFGLRVILVHFVIIAAFGVWWPYLRGVEFFDPVFLSAYACLGVLFSGPAAAQAFREPPPSGWEALVRIGFATLYGELMAAAILLAGMLTALRSRAIPIGPDWVGLAEASVLGLAGSAAMASVAGWMAIRFSPATARTVLRILFLGLLLLFFFESRWLPDVLGRGISICTGVTVLAALAIQRRTAALRP
jgi:hypothetical protein